MRKPKMNVLNNPPFWVLLMFGIVMTKPQAALAGGGHPEFEGIAWKQGWLRPVTKDEPYHYGAPSCKLREPTDEERSGFQNTCREPYNISSMCNEASVDACKREASRYAYDPSSCQSVDECKKKYTAEYFYNDCMKTDFGPLLSRPKCIDLQPTTKMTQQVIPTRKTVKVVSPSASPNQTTPTLSVNPTENSTPSATPTPNQKMSRRATINEIIRLIKSLISSLFKSSPDMGDIAPNITPTLTINQESPTPSKSVCSQQQLTSLRVHILALSTRTKLTNGILNNVCLPKDIKEAYKNYTRLQSKFAKLDEQLCGQNKDGPGCTDGKIRTGDNSEASRIIRELERTDTDFKKASPPSGNYLLYENLLNSINKFLDSE